MKIALHTAAAILLLTALYCGWAGATHIRPSDDEREYRKKEADVDAAIQAYQKDLGRLRNNWNAIAAAALKANDGGTHQTAIAESLVIGQRLTMLERESLMWAEKVEAAEHHRHTLASLSFIIAGFALPAVIFLFLFGRRGEAPRGPTTSHTPPPLYRESSLADNFPPISPKTSSN